MIIRTVAKSDREDIAEIYQAVAGSVEGISRRPHEITDTYVYSLLNKKPADIVFLVAVEKNGKIVGAIHAVKNGLQMYSHILSELTVLVKPEYQSKGVGRQLAFAFLEHVFSKRPDVMRVEMEVIHVLARVKIYEAVGFMKEGETKNRIRNADGTFSNSVLMAWTNTNFVA